MIDKFIDGVGRLADNAWAFSLFMLAGALALVAHVGKDHDLLNFAGVIATTGAAIFTKKRD